MRIYIANPEVASVVEGERSTVIALRDESAQMVELVFTSIKSLLAFRSDVAGAVSEAMTNPGQHVVINPGKKTPPQDALHAAGLLVSPFPAPMFAPSIGQTSEINKPLRQPREPRQPRKPLPPRHP